MSFTRHLQCGHSYARNYVISPIELGLTIVDVKSNHVVLAVYTYMAYSFYHHYLKSYKNYKKPNGWPFSLSHYFTFCIHEILKSKVSPWIWQRNKNPLPVKLKQLFKFFLKINVLTYFGKQDINICLYEYQTEGDSKLSRPANMK